MIHCLSEHIDKHGKHRVCQRESGHFGMHQEREGSAFRAIHRWHNDGRARKANPIRSMKEAEK